MRSIYDPNLSEFEQYLRTKYASSYVPIIMSYVRRFKHLVYNENDLRELDRLNNSIKHNVISSLIVFSKYLGMYEAFKNKLKTYGIKVHRQNTYDSFLRILNSNNNTNILEWYKDAISRLDKNEALFLKYCLLSGLRRSEAILSFNKIIELSKTNKLEEYYDRHFCSLLHFKYKEFIRGTKNALITFIRPELVDQIANCEPIDNRALRYILDKHKIKCRIKELRKYFATYLLQHGILEGEVNMLQGRINSILFKHYFTPKLTELRDRVFKALSELENN